ncbi:unnamed protein product [Fusarium graminearum]|uniref:Chromosome 1, complete genome n=1 Tax=Gibberella zeae (strain ATCC MYA-4620 / CBS 123657 / FGSC 9075 / NRRL 31084 / PH-1) TaxID=229533 RepID=A0A098D0M9_GIBZE|nr:unnamed protein product [Fusarium graminearum]CZS75731.1 unnamed protein product [Fusarium graminearum]
MFPRKFARVITEQESQVLTRKTQRLKLAIGTIDKPRGAMSLKWCPIRKGESARGRVQVSNSGKHPDRRGGERIDNSSSRHAEISRLLRTVGHSPQGS